MKKATTIITTIVVILFIGFLYTNFQAIINYHFVSLYAKSNNVSPSLVLAIIKAESNFDQTAVSSKGAFGLMQLMPETSSWIAGKLGVEDTAKDDALTNVRFGAWYIGSYLLPKYNGNADKAIAAYNAGEGNVDQWQNDEIKFPETAKYLKKVKWYQNLYSLVLGTIFE